MKNKEKIGLIKCWMLILWFLDTSIFGHIIQKGVSSLKSMCLFDESESLSSKLEF